MAERKSKSSEVTQTPEKGEAVKPVTVEGPATPSQETAEPKAARPSSAAPLDAPVKRERKQETGPMMVDANASTPQAAANDTSVRLMTDDGTDINIDDVFEYPTMQNPGALVRVNRRVYKEFNHLGTTRTKTVQLMYPEGAMIHIFEAERVKADLKARQEDPHPGRWAQLP